MHLRTFLPALLPVALATAPTLAGPAPKGAPAGYEAKFKAVVEAEKNEEYEKSLALLDEIPVERHNVYTRLKRATLLVRLGRFIEAEAVLSELMKDPKADAIRATVQGDLDDLRARMPKLTIRLAATSKDDAWVTVDDKPVGPPVTIPVNPGTHVVIAKRAGKEVFKQKVTLQDSQTLELEIDTSLAPPETPVASVSVPTASPVKRTDAGPAPTEPSANWGRALPAFAVGALFVGGSAASFVLMKGAQRSTEESCAAQHSVGCDLDGAGGGRIATFETLGWVSAGLAVASISVGVVLVATTSGAANKTEKHGSLIATPLVAKGTFGFGFEGRF